MNYIISVIADNNKTNNNYHSNYINNDNRIINMIIHPNIKIDINYTRDKINKKTHLC